MKILRIKLKCLPVEIEDKPNRAQYDTFMQTNLINNKHDRVSCYRKVRFIQKIIALKAVNNAICTPRMIKTVKATLVCASPTLNFLLVTGYKAANPK